MKTITKKEFHRLYANAALRYYRETGNAYQFFMRANSGTTGTPSLFSVYRDERASSFHEMRGERYNRLLFAFTHTNIKLYFPLSALRFQGTCDSVMILSEYDYTPSLKRQLATWRPDAIVGTPICVQKLIDALGSASKNLSVRLVKIVGELLTPEFEITVRKSFPRASVVTSYGLSETGVVGIQCSNLPRNHYHPIGNVGVSILDPDARGIGEIAARITLIPTKKVLFRTDDMGTFVKTECGCRSRTFRVLGRRGYDYIETTEFVLTRDAIETAVFNLATYIKDYRATIKTRRDSQTFSMSIYPTQKLAERRNPAEFIAKQLSSSVQFLDGTRVADRILDGSIEFAVSINSSQFTSGFKQIKLQHI